MVERTRLTRLRQSARVRAGRAAVSKDISMSRTLRSKKQRKHLWYQTNGTCANCGKPLPDNWHADHIIPWSVSGETNTHDMQALCPQCNLLKGNKMWRQHQIEMIEICDEILSQAKNTKEVIASVTPGGGKSALPTILAWKLIPSKADAICWVVPRDALRQQGEKVFISSFFRSLTGHNNTIRKSTNDSNPTRGTQGYITTYQSIAADRDLHRQEFARKRYILFLDEPHHIEHGTDWHEALIPLVDQSILVIYASGTFERGNKKRIAFIPYKKQAGGLIVPDLSSTPERSVIKYTRGAALTESDPAIVRLYFEILDGRAEWVDKEGEFQSVDSFNDNDIDVRSALRTALQTSYAHELLEKCTNHWRHHKSTIYASAKLLVVAPSIEDAKDYMKFLKSINASSALATSADNKEARLSIKCFKGEHGVKEVDVLVTVGMAYEGLDVPQITHIACLTYYRSKPWLEQCFARANRTAPGKQYGVIWGPDDPYFRQIMEEIKAEQEKAISDFEGINTGGNPSPKPFQDIVAIESEVTTHRADGLEDNESVDDQITGVILRAARETGLYGLSTVQLNQFLIRAGLLGLRNGSIDSDIHKPLVTPSEQEENLRKSINTYLNRYCFNHNLEYWQVNHEIKKRFGKSRETMTAQELAQVWKYVQQRYSDDS